MNKSNLRAQTKKQPQKHSTPHTKSTTKTTRPRKQPTHHHKSTTRLFSTTTPSPTPDSTTGTKRQKTYMIDSGPFLDFNGIKPEVTERTFVASTAKIIGDVQIGHNTCILDHVTIRGDDAKITIGNYTSIQEGTTIHVDEGFPVEIGDYVTIGHGAIIHGCTIKSNVLVGMGATVLNGTVVGEHSIVGANALVLQNKTYPEKTLLKGSPAKAAEKPISDKEQAAILENAFIYADKIDHFFEMKKVSPNVMPHIQDV